MELLVTISIVALLIGISIPIATEVRAKALKAKCISHLRAMHSAFSSAIQDQGHWPQPPFNEGKWDTNKFYEFWITEMEEYGVTQSTWVCPADESLIAFQKKAPRKGIYYGSYVPSIFTPDPNAPFRYNQPWVVEKASNHGKSGHMLMPDGAVIERVDAFGGR